MALALSTHIAEARRGRGEDRIATVALDGCVLMAVVDGAGGVGRGAAAAEAVCRALVEMTAPPDNWCAWLRARDHELVQLGGMAAAVVLSVRDDGQITGASVGDCEARLLVGGGLRPLTDGQHRKPLLGNGRAVPIDFACALTATLIVASDGLWKYAPDSRVAEAAVLPTSDRAAAALVDCVRLPSGALQDDVAAIVCGRAA